MPSISDAGNAIRASAELLTIVTLRSFSTPMTEAGILTTASDVLFTGGREGYFQALDARTGTLLWKANLGAQIVSGPISYEVEGHQYVATISGLSLCVFGLRE